MRAIAIDVGGTTLKVGVVSSGGALTHRGEVPTPRGVPELVAVVAAQVRLLREAVLRENAAGDETDLVAEVGVVVPGIVDADAGIGVLSVNLGWFDAPMRDLLEEAIGFPVAFGHDVRAGALAESRFGAGTPNYLYVPIGTGVAAGLVVAGTPYAGGGYAGEIGLALVRDPRTGLEVSLESVVSAAALASRYAACAPGFDVARGARGVLEEIEDDPLAREIFDEGVTALAGALATMMCMSGPMRVVIGGGLGNAGETYLAPLRDQLAQRLPHRPAPEVVGAALGSWAQCIGAGSLALDVARERSHDDVAHAAPARVAS